jgi:hypothetical protein
MTKLDKAAILAMEDVYEAYEAKPPVAKVKSAIEIEMGFVKIVNKPKKVSNVDTTKPPVAKVKAAIEIEMGFVKIVSKPKEVINVNTTKPKTKLPIRMVINEMGFVRIVSKPKVEVNPVRKMAAAVVLLTGTTIAYILRKLV